MAKNYIVDGVPLGELMENLKKENDEKSKKDDEFLILGTEVAMSIINIQTRKLTLRKNLFSRMMDEKGLVLAASIILLELNNLLHPVKNGQIAIPTCKPLQKNGVK